jgi:hypothetical protein
LENCDLAVVVVCAGFLKGIEQTFEAVIEIPAPAVGREDLDLHRQPAHERLDAQTRELLLEEVLALTAGATLVWVTHHLQEAVRVADRVVLLRVVPGRIRAILPVPIPVGERDRPAALAELARLERELWELLREDARRAETALTVGAADAAT